MLIPVLSDVLDHCIAKPTLQKNFENRSIFWCNYKVVCHVSGLLFTEHLIFTKIIRHLHCVLAHVTWPIISNDFAASELHSRHSALLIGVILWFTAAPSKIKLSAIHRGGQVIIDEAKLLCSVCGSWFLHDSDSSIWHSTGGEMKP